jgi:Ser/Thr protein kinase RdoA (MazF antagonist)
VIRVAHDGGPDWIVRVFPGSRPLALAHGDAQILRFLERAGYPAERCAAPQPVSVHRDQAVLVTEFIDGAPRAERRSAVVKAGGLRAPGAMLGALQTLPGSDAVTRAGGAWHHLADGGPDAEIAAAIALLQSARDRVPAGEEAQYESLLEALRGLDGGDGLPEALLHPDFVLANVVATTAGLVLVDWAGTGRGPRAWALAFLLFSVGFGGDLARVERASAGYARRVRPAPEELERLPALIRARPLIFESWAFAAGRRSLADAARGVPEAYERADAIAEAARRTFAAL